MRRPKATAPKAPHLSVAATAAQLASWTRDAESKGLSLSAWVRFTLDEAVDNSEIETKGGAMSNADMQNSLDRFTRRMQKLLDGRSSTKRR